MELKNVKEAELPASFFSVSAHGAVDLASGVTPRGPMATGGPKAFLYSRA